MSSHSTIRRSLEDRIILCADCDATRRLSLSTSGSLVCSTCGSDNWMHLPMTANLKESIFIKGELNVEEDLTVEGRVEGKIELKDHNLWISPHGNVKAEIHAKSVIIAGNVTGNIFASEMVEIRQSGSVQGNIRCPRISLVDGAKFTGRIDTEKMADAAARLGLQKGSVSQNGSGSLVVSTTEHGDDTLGASKNIAEFGSPGAKGTDPKGCARIRFNTSEQRPWATSLILSSKRRI